MEVQISPSPQFNGSNDPGIMRVPPAFQPLSKRFKSDLAFQCMVCNATFDDPTSRYEHMDSQHRDSYGNGFDSDSDDEINEDLSRLLEPICEIKLIDEDESSDLQSTNAENQHLSNVPANLLGSNGQVVGEQFGPQIGLHVQMQLQQHLIQSQMNNAQHFTQPQLQPNQDVQLKTSNNNHQNQPTPSSIRKFGLIF